MFDSYLGESIIARAIKHKKIVLNFYNPRDYTKDKHKSVDDKPYGGGPGMVLRAEPILKSVEAARRKLKMKNEKLKIIILSPGGKQFNNSYAENLAEKYTDIILIAGHYEGIDARVARVLKDYKLPARMTEVIQSGGRTTNYKPISVSEISIGPYTLTGGELPAMVIVDAVTRRLPGVLGKDESVEERRVASGEVYTRPEVIEHGGKEYKVPDVLISGHHKKIDKWRSERMK